MASPIGFPFRALRDAFGPTIKNRYPVRSPAYELDGEIIGNLMMAQIAGSGLTAVLAWLLIKVRSSAPTTTILWRSESWNVGALSTGAFAPPDVTRDSAGIFEISYPAQVPDFQGVLRTLTFTGGAAFYIDDNVAPLMARVVPDFPGSSHVKVRGWLISGGAQTPTDGTFLIGLV